MVQFQAAVAVSEIVIREFSAYQRQDLVNLKHFMLSYCLHRPRYVRVLLYIIKKGL
jgi:hypothetical protein